MSMIEAALMRTAQASFGLFALYVGKENCLFTVDGGERGVLFQKFGTAVRSSMLCESRPKEI